MKDHSEFEPRFKVGDLVHHPDFTRAGRKWMFLIVGYEPDYHVLGMLGSGRYHGFRCGSHWANVDFHFPVTSLLEYQCELVSGV